jgi:hypothetical protein
MRRKEYPISSCQLIKRSGTQARTIRCRNVNTGPFFARLFLGHLRRDLDMLDYGSGKGHSSTHPTPRSIGRQTWTTQSRRDPELS